MIPVPRPKYFRLPLLAVVIAICLTAASCSSSLKSYSSLANQGILPLSTTNPYLGSNLFLGQELQRSSVLFNFFKSRGSPAAIEIEEEGFGPTHLILYYPRDKEVYLSELGGRGQTSQWIVRGPFSIDRKDFLNLNRMALSPLGEPVFMIDDRQFRFRFQREYEDTKIAAPILAPPLPTPTPKPVVKKKPKIIKVVGDEKVDKDPTFNTSGEFRPLNTDQQAIQMSKGFAERAENGDIIHTVKSDKESVEAIAAWYTGSAKNGAELAKLSDLKEGEAPTIGKRIRVPVKKITQFKAMAGN